MKYNKKIIGLVIFAVIIALFLVNPMTYTDLVKGYALERKIISNKIQSHHFSVFSELTTEKTNKMLLEHGDKLLEMEFYKELIELEDLNEDDKLNSLLAEAYYLEWLYTSIEEPYRVDRYLVYADKLAEGKVDKYFMPLFMRRSFSVGELYKRKDYVTEDYKAIYDDVLAKEISNSIIHVIDSEVIYSRDNHLWWVPEDTSIIHEKDLAIKTFLIELQDTNNECFNRTIYYLLQKDRGNNSSIQDYLKHLELLKYYDQPLQKVNYIASEGQLLDIGGVPYLYVQGGKYDNELDRHQIGYFKINLNTGEHEFYEGSTQVVWREDGQYAFYHEVRYIIDEDGFPRLRKSEIGVYNKYLHLIETFTFDVEYRTNVSWVGNELFIDDFDVRKIYRPETRELEQDIKITDEVRLGLSFSGLIISTDRYSKGFAYFSDEGILLYETDKIVITDSVLIKDNRIIYQTLDDVGIYVYCTEDERLNFIDTKAKLVAAMDDYLLVLDFEENDYLSVLVKMDLSGEIVETYSFYNTSEIKQSKGTKLLDK